MNSRSNRLIKVLLISLHVLSASSVPLIMSDALIIQPSLLNTTTNVTIPPPSPADPRMTIRASYRLDVLLDPKSVLAIVTNEMAKLAIMDYNGRLGSFQSTPWAGYSDTKIQFKVSAAAQRVETRIAVWSLYYLAANMGILNRYCHVQFRILWDNVQVATLRISCEVVTGDHRATGWSTTEQHRGFTILTRSWRFVRRFQRREWYEPDVW